jgi:hypothetical protein
MLLQVLDGGPPPKDRDSMDPDRAAVATEQAARRTDNAIVLDIILPSDVYRKATCWTGFCAYAMLGNRLLCSLRGMQ